MHASLVYNLMFTVNYTSLTYFVQQVVGLCLESLAIYSQSETGPEQTNMNLLLVTSITIVVILTELLETVKMLYVLHHTLASTVVTIQYLYCLI